MPDTAQNPDIYRRSRSSRDRIGFYPDIQIIVRSLLNYIIPENYTVFLFCHIDLYTFKKYWKKEL